MSAPVCRVEIKAHPFASAFPLLEGAAYEQLRDDIKEFGLLDDEFETLDGMQLDGRNRKRVCDELGIPYKLIEYKGDNPFAFVVSRNLQRRNLEFHERVLVATKLVSLKPGRPKKGSRAGAISVADASKLMGVGESSVHLARSVLKTAAPEVVAAMNTGEVTIDAAGKLAELELAEQAPALKRVLEAETRKRAAQVEKELKKKSPANDELPDALPVLVRTITRAATVIGGSVKKVGDGGLMIALHGQVLAVSIELKQDTRAA